MRSIFLLLFISLSLYAHSQDVKTEERLILGDTIVFLGIDFSMAKMINPADVDLAIKIKEKHGPYWSIIGPYMCQHSSLSFDFKKKYVACMAHRMDSSYTQLDSNWIVSSYHGITQQEIAQHIKTYAPLPHYKVAFVFVVDRLDKIKSTLVMYGAYINLKDNSVLKTIKCEGRPDGFGYGMYWATGIDQAYLHFTIDNSNYIHRLKHLFKKSPKSAVN